MPISRPTRRSLLAGLLIVPLALTACSGGEDYVPDPEALQIYSSQHQEITQAWADSFTEQTGIETQVRRGQDSSMGHMIVEEGEASPADVFLTENSPAMTVVDRAGLLAPVDQAATDQVPEQLVPSSGHWMPIAARSTVLIYNPSEISEAELPQSMMDLADPEWAGRWGAAPGGADFQAIVAGMLADRGEEPTRAWLEALEANAEVYQNNIATMKAVNAGEVPVGIMYHYYWYRDQAGDRSGSGNTQLHYFGNQDTGAFVSLSAGGVVASSDMPEEAQQFLAYVTSPEGQQVLADSGSMEYAVGTGVESDPALPPLDTLDAPPVDPATLNSDQVIQLMTDAGIL
ncbi:iron ABC transporter substrate-binding protein [Ornithinimicrobium cryptoxanthini]|uniref:Iron ABC transporter substrate-binding protein n=1 Tax=Ornithinimicrobium cryptoxanthini TaxID=2934161 RepID=A0ABY4YIM5_9MICO|nr:iron ABC transporter substrate-binding protein [Ornithinimicrobium cryptoxanthini]USQ76645.1 iron ABC transporter substrate-binding protein [Ornithinimicrobium cryptoxanthini]